MFTDFSIQNFRVFDNEGATVPLRPITILTGCNNSGKSSIVKSLCLLKDFCQRLEADFKDRKKLDLMNYKMDFHKSPNNIMGGFYRVKHHASKVEKDKLDKNINGNTQEDTNDNVIFDFIVESSWLLQDVILHLEFNTLAEDDLNNGYLQAYSLLTLEGDEIYKATRGGKASMNLSKVKKSFLHFLYGQYAFSEWQNNFQKHQASGDEPDDEEYQFIGDVGNAIIDNLSYASFKKLIELQVYNYPYSSQDTFCMGIPIPYLNKCLDKSFIINSPSLGVYCYFPCLWIYKDIEKKDVRREIYNRIESQVNPISSLSKKIVDLFLDSFEASNTNYLYEFISQKEDERFFVTDKIGFGGGFVYPHIWHLRENICFFPYDESNLPTTANWYIILLAMDIINRLTTNDKKTYLVYDMDGRPSYAIENKINNYIRLIIEDAFANLLPGSLDYSPTTIVQPRRMYSLEENSDFARTLKNYFETKRVFGDKQISILSHQNKKYKSLSFINKWLKQLEIAHHVEIKSHADGYGVTIHLYEDEKDKKGTLLVDKGYGILQLFSVLLKIEVSILKMIRNDRVTSLNNGFNLELMDEIRKWKQLNPITVALEEPECHLHPSLQSKFADMIVDAYKQYDVHFIIESHSEYFIRKLQLLVSQKEIMNDDISLLYINPASRPSHIPVITDIGLEEDGCLKNEFGSGFFDESLRLGNELLKYKEDDDIKMENDEDQA